VSLTVEDEIECCVVALRGGGTEGSSGANNAWNL
jgi:hypothetical protein